MLGWIKLYRELIDKPIWKCSTPEQNRILITLLCMANHEPNEWEWKGQRYTVQAGQFITSVQSIVDRCACKDITTKKVRTALDRFEKFEFLTREVANKSTLITIVNWRLYQDQASQEGKQRANKKNTDFVEKNQNDEKRANERANKESPETSQYSGFEKTDEEKRANGGATRGQTEGKQRANKRATNKNIKNDNNDNNSYLSINPDTPYTPYKPYTPYQQGIDKTDRIDIDTLFVEQLKANIHYDDLCVTCEKSDIDNIIDLAFDLISVSESTIHIGRKVYPKDYVKSKLLTLDGAKVGFLIDKIKKIGYMDEVRNPTRYMQSVIFSTAINYNTEFQEYFNRTYYHGGSYE